MNNIKLKLCPEHALNSCNYIEENTRKWLSLKQTQIFASHNPIKS